MRAVYAAGVDVYRALGWTDLLPLPPGQKWPPEPGFTGGVGRSPTADEIDEWKSRRAGWNLALRLPPNVVGIDVDDYGDKGGGATLAALEAAWGHLPETWISTARAGLSGIRLYGVPAETRLNGVAGPGIEVIQEHHRYVCAWPSTNPKAGGAQYHWLSPDGQVAARPPRPEELPALPSAWVAGLSPRKVEAGPVFVASNVPSSYAGAALENAAREVAAAPAGQGNSALNGCAYSLGRLVGAGLIDRVLVEETLVSAAVQRGGETEARARRIVASGIEAGMAKPRRIVEFRRASA